ncbi:hypothetical protein PTTG_09159 [Puccinia triticina 1-1 BBBD Race 1]|uniref:Uncharacterized protein n=2 Tax=Puccinia triticina TaxID=208348 RepID=A0A0C4F7M5_PUCT1|nr:uncharacterized protein PtA15_17A264 [Puccinia triticina]OAV88207.1 hypothetical protein PTTG_09159 [Puccinia triticina 1-1 BBBD Race 1]WAQ92782.1 hypothetical protein PtA15_17A264 [Puccinia triticina]
MLDAFTRYSRPKLIRRDSGSSTHGDGTAKAQLSRRISSDQPRRATEGPDPSLAASSSAGSLSNRSKDGQRDGHSLKQTLAKLRHQRLRPLSLFTANPKIIRTHRPSRSRESIESTDSDQSHAGAAGRPQSSSTHSSHVIPRAVLEHGGDYVMVHSEYVQDLPDFLPPPNSMPEISSSGVCLKDDKKTWSYNLGGLTREIRSSERLVVEEGSDSSLDDEMLDTLCTLRYTIKQMKEHQRQPPQLTALVKCDSLPTFGLASSEHNGLSRTFSVPSRFVEDETRPFGPLNGFSLQSCLVAPAHRSAQLSVMDSDTHCSRVHSFSVPNPGSMETEDEADDTSSFCTLSEEEPDYQSCPYVLPIWPNLSSELHPSFD